MRVQICTHIRINCQEHQSVTLGQVFYFQHGCFRIAENIPKWKGQAWSSFLKGNQAKNGIGYVQTDGANIGLMVDSLLHLGRVAQGTVA